MIRIFGVVLIAVGATLLYFGYNASQTVGEQIAEGFTGRFTNETMAYLVGGIAAVVCGLGIVVWGARNTNN